MRTRLTRSLPKAKNPISSAPSKDTADGSAESAELAGGATAHGATSAAQASLRPKGVPPAKALPSGGAGGALSPAAPTTALSWLALTALIGGASCCLVASAICMSTTGESAGGGIGSKSSKREVRLLLAAAKLSFWTDGGREVAGLRELAREVLAL